MNYGVSAAQTCSLIDALRWSQQRTGTRASRGGSGCRRKGRGEACEEKLPVQNHLFPEVFAGWSPGSFSRERQSKFLRDANVKSGVRALSWVTCRPAKRGA